MIVFANFFCVVFEVVVKTKHWNKRDLQISSMRLPPAVTAKSKQLHERFTKPVAGISMVIHDDGFARQFVSVFTGKIWLKGTVFHFTSETAIARKIRVENTCGN